MTDTLGWLATAVFTCSYFFRSASSLRWIQACAALLWIVYGVLLHATPVVAANVIVALAAAGSTLVQFAGARRVSDSRNEEQREKFPSASPPAVSQQ